MAQLDGVTLFKYFASLIGNILGLEDQWRFVASNSRAIK